MKESHRVLVCYDCADDFRRSRLSRTLLDTRIQDSVFECIVESDGLADLLERVRKILATAPEDRICVVELCAACGERIRTIGRSPRASEAESRII